MSEDERVGQKSVTAANVELLERGEIEVKGRMPWSSNATFLVSVCHDGRATDAIYKPERGERPLWDFPPGLYKREVAAYLVDQALGWNHVPETVVRDDAPFGSGSLQRFIDAQFDEHYFTLLENEEHGEQLREIAVFDLVINNADRKSGHCLLEEGGKIWAIDHGVSLSDEPKLRTVMWDFAGEPLPQRLRDDAARVALQLPRLHGLLDSREFDALSRRLQGVARAKRFPNPSGDRPYPWPLV